MKVTKLGQIPEEISDVGYREEFTCPNCNTEYVVFLEDLKYATYDSGMYIEQFVKIPDCPLCHRKGGVANVNSDTWKYIKNKHRVKQVQLTIGLVFIFAAIFLVLILS